MRASSLGEIIRNFNRQQPLTPGREDEWYQVNPMLKKRLAEYKKLRVKETKENGASS